MTDWLDVTERSAVAEARRRTLALADEAGLGVNDRERAAIVATEAATNLLKHAGRGRIALFAAPELERPELSIVAVDRGAGIGDLDRMSQDGQSTAGSAGTGLGAMARQSDDLDIHTGPDGTVLTARIGRRGADAAGRDHEIGALMDRYPGAAVCGDAYAVRREAGGALLLMVCDGLGHGPAAHEAATAVRTAFLETDAASPARLLAAMGAAAAATRGAVGSVVRLDPGGNALHVAGVGNVSGLIVPSGKTISGKTISGKMTSDKARRLLSRDGRLGGPMPRLTDTAEPWEPGALLILHSDGIRTLRDIDTRQSLLAKAPLTIAATLLRDDARGNDDACVLVVRRGRAEASV